MTIDDLDAIFGELATQLSTLADDNFIFSSQTLPHSPERLVTRNIYIQRGAHYYESYYRIDQLHFHASKLCYRYLGLLILSAAFHFSSSEIHLETIHPASEIKHFFIKFAHPNLDDPPTGYTSQPYCFNYYPDSTYKYPWTALMLPPIELPCFYLTDLHGTAMGDEEWNQRDTIRGLGCDSGGIRFAELLLNASVSHNPLNEYQLEGEMGWRGVGVGSAEVRLWLPGSAAWDADQWTVDPTISS